VPDNFPSKQEIHRLAREAGFDLTGIAGVNATREHLFFPDWLAAGHAGEMRYLESRNESGGLKRASLANAAPWARSVVVCAINYNSNQPYSTHAGTTSQGWISRYAWGRRDYHDVLLPRLRRLESEFLVLCEQRSLGKPRTWCYVDTGPVIERIFAKYAGIGWIGKNTCVLNESLGSWFFLGVMLTSIELQPDFPVPDRCGSCTRCLEACPTDAFLAPYQLDATKCISYLTIEKRGTVPKELREGIGRHLFGCDICQDVCPWNRKAPVSSCAVFEAQQQLVNPDLERLAGLSADEFREEFRGTPVKRARYTGFLRNVAIAMGNSGEKKFLPALQILAQHPDHVVAEAAEWAIVSLQSRPDEATNNAEPTRSASKRL
jgi:epoxyqueuosine reductase